MKKFSFKKPDISFTDVKMPWGKKKVEEAEVEQPAEVEIPEQETVSKKKFSFKMPDMPWHKTEKEKPVEEEKTQEPAKEAPKAEKPEETAKPDMPKQTSDQELERLRSQLTLWRWIAASCAFAALSALILLG